MSEGKVLILNQDYSPLDICSVNRAFLLVFLSKAELLEKDNDKTLRTVTNAFPYPTVIKIKQYVNVPYHGVVLSRYNLFKRDNNQCQYCGKKNELTLDHLVPKSKGGKSSWKNLVTACKRCNTKKGNMNLEEAGLKLNRLPFKPSYVTFLKSNFGETRKDWLRYLDTHAVA